MSGRMRGWLAALALVWAMLPVAAQTRVEYIHTDLLGSVVAITDEAGAVIERREYEPYGAQLTLTLRDGPGYTGHVQDAATGLVCMLPGYYDQQTQCRLHWRWGIRTIWKLTGALLPPHG